MIIKIRSQEIMLLILGGVVGVIFLDLLLVRVLPVAMDGLDFLTFFLVCRIWVVDSLTKVIHVELLLLDWSEVRVVSLLKDTI